MHRIHVFQPVILQLQRGANENWRGEYGLLRNSEFADLVARQAAGTGRRAVIEAPMRCLPPYVDIARISTSIMAIMATIMKLRRTSAGCLSVMASSAEPT